MAAESNLESRETREQRARYDDLFEFASVGYLVTDESGKVLEANRTAAGLLGVSQTALIGKPIAIFVPVDGRRQFRQTLLGLVGSTSTAEWELELTSRDGRSFRALLDAAPAIGGGLRWMVQDISDRDASERRLRMLTSALEERVLERTEELEQEKASLTAIVAQIPAGLVVAEAPSGRILTANERARRMLGVEDGAALPGIRGAAFRADGSMYELDEFPLARALRGETVQTERLEIAWEDGQRFFVDVSAAPVRDRAGRVTSAVWLLEDVTARERRDRAERDFVTNAAHELQSPIAAIKSAVEVLQAGAKDAPDRDLFIDHIDRETHRLVRLTGALLTLSRAQTDIEKPRTELVDLRTMLQSTAERMEPADGVSLAVECAPEIALVANRELLEQLISSVVHNAVKYTEQGSIRIHAELDDGQAEIRVIDTGVGIPADALPRVVERFYRGDVSKEGFGLGLAIVQAALDAMGGDLRIVSEGPGQGTTVTVTMPLGATQVPH